MVIREYIDMIAMGSCEFLQRIVTVQVVYSRNEFV
jgi:hypothetical protein